MRTSRLAFGAVIDSGKQVGASSMEKVSSSPRTVRFGVFEATSVLENCVSKE